MKPRTLIFTLTFFCISSSIHLSAQKDYENWSIEKVVKRMAKNNYCEYHIDDWGFGSPEQTTLEYELRKRATNQELVDLCNHRKAVIRAYAISILDDRKYENLFPLVLDRIFDYKLVDNKGYQSFVEDEAVGEFFAEVEHLNPQERAIIDSMLIFTDNELEYTNDVLYNLNIKPKHYHRIKELVDTKYTAIVALAKFQNPIDIPLIKEEILNNEYITRINAIEYFPDDAFKPLLTKLIEEEESFGYDDFEKAVAAYQDSFALQYFEDILKKVGNASYRDNYVEPIWNALVKYKAPIYNELLFEFWEKDFKINIEEFDYLLAFDSIRCKQLAICSIENAIEINNYDEHTLPHILDYLIENDYKIACTLIIQQLKEHRGLDYMYFTNAAISIHDDEVFEVMFERLERDNSVFNTEHLITAFLRLEDEEINKRLVKTIKSNSNLKDRQIENIKEIFKENNVVFE